MKHPPHFRIWNGERMKLQARQSELDIFWDNSSESAMDPTSPVGNDFEACERAGLQTFSANIETILTALAATGAQLYVAILDDQSKRPVMTDDSLRSASFDRFSAEE